MGESMNENPYASPKTYGERRAIDWDRVGECVAGGWYVFVGALLFASFASALWRAF